MSKYRFRYEYTNLFSIEHRWCAIGRHGGIHVHISDHGKDYAEKYGKRYSGGIEIHYRTPPLYMADQAPSHDMCFLLKCPCWHDGSSLQATEEWIPFWLMDKNDHDGMFQKLAKRMDTEWVDE